MTRAAVLFIRLISEATRRAPRATLAKVRRRLSPDRKVLYLFGLTEPRELPVEASAAAHHVFRFAGLEDLRRDIAEGRWNWSPGELELVQRGAKCLVQLEGDRLVGYTWASCLSPALLTDGVRLSLPPDVGYVFKAYTRREYRGKGFQPLRTLQLLHHLREEGKRRLLCYVDDTNVESLHGVHKSGYVRIGTVTIVRGAKQFRSSIAIDNEFWADLHVPEP